MGANRKGLLIAVVAITSLLIAIQLGSGVWLFAHKLGFDPDRIAAAYLGDPDAFIAGRSIVGVLQMAVPHAVAMGTVALLMGHLLPHCGMAPRWTRLLSAAMFVGIVGEIATPFLILTVSPGFAWGKLASFAVFEIGIAVTLMAVLVSSAKKHSY